MRDVLGDAIARTLTTMSVIKCTCVEDQKNLSFFSIRNVYFSLGVVYAEWVIKLIVSIIGIIFSSQLC